ncbi:VCBS repeat-containing protein [Myxococcus sp. CA051A]|uniref:polymorphic toxin-type HINT domain-containing protein n=1 Tax=Myxococcus sp. CA051A TaxID=2741739 RepID=UPI00157B37C2|nr:polymorphic toxin-type HINT domain-containing protein [Myxococcus sp. CA051A]NTX65880.1 VCBS repeat-containing protein [Myxococcus sp. CA051A]
MKRFTSMLVLSVSLLHGAGGCGSSQQSPAPESELGQSRERVLNDDPLVIPPFSMMHTETKSTGTTPGQVDANFNVTSDGAASYGFPLWVPQGRAGLEPKLSLGYHSRAGNGLVGVGWAVNGFSQVMRCRKTFAQDGLTAPVRFLPEDAFCLDGKRLVVVASSGSLIEYRTEVESFSKVLAHIDGTGAPDYFEVYSKDGRILSYGKHATTFSRLEGQRLSFTTDPATGVVSQGPDTTVRLSWALSEVRDRAGNDLRIRYVLDGNASSGYEHVPDRIDYTGHTSDTTDNLRRRSVRFVYPVAARPDSEVRFVSGLKLRASKRLSRIEMYGPGLASTPTTRNDVLLRAYELSYRVARVTRRSLLDRVFECDGQGICRDPVELSYTEGVDCSASPDNDCDDPVVQLRDFQAVTATELVGGNYVPIRDVKTLGAPDATLGGQIIPGVQDFWTLHTLDINGDGRDDLLYRRNDQARIISDPVYGNTVSLGDSVWYYRLAASAGVFGPPINAQLPLSKSGNGDDDLRIVDMNGDGVSEVVALQRADASGQNGYYQLYRFNGSAFEPANIQAAETFQFWWEAATSTTPVRVPVMQVADMNGDGLPELFRSTKSPQPYDWGYRMNQGGFVLSAYTQVPLRSGVDHAGYTVDVDGDGSTEVLVRTADTRTDDDFSAQYLAVGVGAAAAYRYADAGLSAVPVASSPSLNWRWHYNRTWFVDINGDGLADAVSSRRDRDTDSHGTLYGDLLISINTGNGFMPPVAQNLDARHELSPSWIRPNPRGLDPGVRVMDFDRDGRQDLLVTDAGDYSGRTETRAKVWVLLGRDDHFEPRELDIPVGHSTGGTSVAKPFGYGQRFSQVFDANGDGLADIIQVEDDLSVPVAQQKAYGVLRVYLRQGELPDALTAVRVGKHGKAVTARYQHFLQQPAASGQPRIHTPGTCVYPQQCPRNMWVVVESGVDDGTRTSNFNKFFYAYEAARTDVQGHGWQGFGKRTLINRQTNATTVTTYDNQSRTSGLYLRSFIPATEATALTLATGVRHEHQRGHLYTVATSAGGRPFLYANQVTDEYREGTGTTLPLTRRSRQLQAQDAHGNATTTDQFDDEVLAGALTGRSWHTKTEVPIIDNLVANWLMGLPRRVVVTSTTADLRTQTRVLTHEYDSRGLLQQTVMEPTGGADVTLTTLYGRDAFGLVEQVSRTGSGTTRVERTHYDAVEHLLPATTFNAQGHRNRMAYHPGLGIPLVIEDSNGLLTHHRYDGFGRLRSTVAPSGETELVNYGADSLGWLKVTTQVVGGQQTAVTADNLGREIRRDTRGFDNRIVTVLSSYDALGRKVNVSRPYSGVAPVRYSVATYDLMDRPLSLTAPEGGAVTYTYDGRKTTRLDERNNKTTTESNAIGQLVASSAYEATGRELRTTYAFGPFGVLRQVTDSAGNSVVLEHDVLGRRTQVTDPDSGVSTTLYNAFGDPRLETDGKGGQTVYDEYDALGRQKRVTTPDGQYALEWDTSLKGAITSSTSPDGVTVAHLYNIKGQLEQSTWNIEGSAYAVNRTYDANGRLATVQYPQAGARRLSVVHSYSDYGFLKEVRSPTEPKAYWTAQGYDDLGQLTQEQLGNDVVTHLRHDPRGRLRFIDSKRGATALQGLAYEWDLEGNLLNRNDVLSRTTEDFEYDTLDRLKKWTVFQNCRRSALEYHYDDLGNLLERRVLEGTGTATTSTYTGPGAGPHAVKQTQAGAYGYDANGNQVSAPSRAVTYTAFDLPRRITGTGREVSFKYDGGQGRVLKRSSLGGVTTYVGGLYEKRQQGGQTQHVFHVSGGPRTVAQVVWTDGGADQTLYLLGDHLGSTERVVDALGNVLDGERMKFEPFGAGRMPHALPVAASVGTSSVKKGFTGHEADDEFGLVNMGGRIYDPETARFLTPDPFVQFPHDGQSYNRYAYTLNNPLRWTDPTGFQAQGDDLPDGGETIVRAPRYQPPNLEAGAGAAEWGGPPAELSRSADQNGTSSLEAQHKALVRQQPGNLPRYMAQHGLSQPTLGTYYGTEHEWQMARFEHYRRMTGEVVKVGLEFVAVDLLTRGVGRVAKFAFRAAIVDGAMALRMAGSSTTSYARAIMLGGGCFVAGTPVLALAGPVPIEEVREGDWVWAWDEETQEPGWHQVSRTFVKPDRAVLLLELISEDAGSLEALGVTAEHPFWVQGRGWTQAQMLAPGDALQTVAGNPIRVHSLQSLPGPETVYNFEVEHAHTYFVGELSTWVHNISSIAASRVALNELPESVLYRISKGGFGSPRNPRPPTLAEFNPRIYELSAGELSGRIATRLHPTNDIQRGGILKMSNDDLIMFRLDDPISASGAKGGLSLSGGHHRTEEIIRRVQSGEMDPGTMVKVLLHD